MMPEATDRTFERSEILDAFAAALRSEVATFGDIIERNRVRFGPEWEDSFISDLLQLYGSAEGWDDAVKGYVRFSRDAMWHQLYFEKHRSYKNRSFAEVQAAYLNNAEHMEKNYLPGMFVSSYLWPQHYLMAQAYANEFLPVVRETIQPRTFVEVGTGSGVYTLLTLRGLPEARGTGFDLSAHSVAFTERLLSAFALGARCRIVHGDAFAGEAGQADFVVSHEVLEHLEDPRAFSRALHHLLRPGGMGYVTAAVTAGHSDHIYLFRSPEEVAAMLEDVGFRIVTSRVELAYDHRPLEVTPRIAGYLVRRAS